MYSIKKNALTFVLALCLIFPCALIFSACGGGGNGKETNYKIIFVVDDNLNYHTITFDGSSNITLPNDPQKDYYRFDGWFLDNGTWENQLTIDYFVNHPITSDIRVYAKMTDIAEYYTVTFDTNGGSAVDSIENVRENSTIAMPTNPTKENCEFLGWYTLSGDSDDLITSEWDFANDLVTENITLYAQWLQNYLVTYVHNYEGVANTQRMTVGGLVDYIPTRDGYIFNGWYLSDGVMDGQYMLTQKFDTTQAVTSENLVLYAEWVEEPTISTQLSAPVVYINPENDRLVWDAVTGATGYDVEIYLGSTNVDTYTNISVTELTMSGYASGKYTIKVRAKGDGTTSVNSVWTTKYYSLRVLSAPTNISIDMTTSIVTWSAVKNATSYEVYVGGSLASEVTECEFDMSAYDAGSYSVKIVAKATNYTSASQTATLEKRKLLAPSLHTSFNSQTQKWRVYWSPVQNADKYYVYVNEVNKRTLNTTELYIEKDSDLWDGAEVIRVYVTAYDSNTNYLVSVPSKAQTLAKYYAITVTKNIDDAGSITTSNVVTGFCGVAGSTYTLTANVNSGYNFEGWYDGQTLLTTELAYTFTMPSNDVALNAQFSFYTVTTTKNISDAGTITQYTDKKFASGQTVTLTATPKTGYNFVGWFDSSEYTENEQTAVAKSTERTYAFTMVKQNVNLIAVFNYYTVTTTANIADAGSTNYSTETKVSVGRSVTLTATTNDGYNFVGWFDTDEYAENAQTAVPKSTNKSYEFTMGEGNVSLIAVFNYYTVVTSVDTVGAGSTNYSTETKVSVDTEVTVIATTNSGYNFVGWYGESGSLVSSLSSYTFTMAEQNVVLVAKFTCYTVTTSMFLERKTDESLSDVGTITQYTNESFSTGAQVTLTATVKDCYNFVGWFDAEEYNEDASTATAKGTELTYKFTMGETSVNLVAVYNFYTLTFTMLDPNCGTLTEPKYMGTNKISVGTTVRLQLILNSGYTYGGWYDADEYRENPTTAKPLAQYQMRVVTISNEDVNLIYVNGYKDLRLNIIVNGEPYTTIDYTLEKSVTLPDISVEGQTISSSWYTDADCTDKFNYSSTGNPFTALTISSNQTYLYKGSYTGNLTNCEFAYDEDTDTYKLQSAYGKSNSILPSTFNGKSVTGFDAILNVTSITSLTIPAGYTLTEGKLYSFKYLQNLTIPYVGIYDDWTVSAKYTDMQLGILFGKTTSTSAPYGYTIVTQFNYDLSHSNKTNHTYMFPASLKNITVTGGYIAEYAFAGLSQLESIKIERLSSTNANAIADYAFSGCTGLKELVVPSDVTTYGTHLVEDCTSLEKLTMPAGFLKLTDFYKTIVEVSFNGGTELDLADFGSQTTYEKLTDVYLGDTITTIKSTNEWASSITTTNGYNLHVDTLADYLSIDFQIGILKNAKLVVGGVAIEGEYTFPETVTAIPAKAFYNYQYFTKVTIPSTVQTIGASAFEYIGTEECKVDVVINGVKTISESAFKSQYIQSVTLTEGIETIGAEAFYLVPLTEVVIPKSIKSIGSSAFDVLIMQKLQTIYYCGTSTEWNAVSVNSNNSAISGATVYYYSEEQPTTEGNYWRNVEGVPTIWTSEADEEGEEA